VKRSGTRSGIQHTTSRVSGSKHTELRIESLRWTPDSIPLTLHGSGDRGQGYSRQSRCNSTGKGEDSQTFSSFSFLTVPFSQLCMPAAYPTPEAERRYDVMLDEYSMAA
jgi:hypothetical protein